MAFVPFSPRAPRAPHARRGPLSLTEQVQRACRRHTPNLIAFKVIPCERVPSSMLFGAGREDVNEWGGVFMLSGGMLGSMVVQDLAAITHEDMVSSCDWAMPDGHKITTVAVYSKGEAEQYPADLLLLEHAPDLAAGSIGAHVFHFFDEGEASLFQGILCMEIEARRDLLN